MVQTIELYSRLHELKKVRRKLLRAVKKIPWRSGMVRKTDGTEVRMPLAHCEMVKADPAYRNAVWGIDTNTRACSKIILEIMKRGEWYGYPPPKNLSELLK